MPSLQAPSLLRLLALLACATVLSGCAHWNGRRGSVLEGRYPGGTPHYRVELDAEGRKHGTERWWHENGTLKSETEWRAGRGDGVFQGWRADGTRWYAGRDSLGVRVDTLRFWHANGRLQSVSVFARGVPVRVDRFDTAGRTPEEAWAHEMAERARAVGEAREDSVRAARTDRQRAEALWAARVREAVEPYWSLPESQRKVRRRAVARIRVAPSGKMLQVAWVEKSGSREFDRRAARALQRVKKLPPPPSELGEGPLTLRYVFTTPGLVPPRRKITVRDPGRALD